MQDEGQALDNSWGYLAIQNLKEIFYRWRWYSIKIRLIGHRGRGGLRWIPALDRENSFRSRWLSEKAIDAWSLGDSGALDESDLRKLGVRMPEKDQGHKEEPSYQTDFWLLGCPESLSTMIYVKASIDIGERIAWPRRECGKSHRSWSAEPCRLVIDPGCTQSLYCREHYNPSVVRGARHEHPPRLRRSS